MGECSSTRVSGSEGIRSHDLDFGLIMQMRGPAAEYAL